MVPYTSRIPSAAQLTSTPINRCLRTTPKRNNRIPARKTRFIGDVLQGKTALRRGSRERLARGEGVSKQHDRKQKGADRSDERAPRGAARARREEEAGAGRAAAEAVGGVGAAR